MPFLLHVPVPLTRHGIVPVGPSIYVAFSVFTLPLKAVSCSLNLRQDFSPETFLNL